MACARGGLEKASVTKKGLWEGESLQSHLTDLLLEQAGEAPGDTLNNLVVGSFHHDPNLVFGPGVADEDSPLRTEPTHLFGQGGLVAGEGLERGSRRNPLVQQDLRHGIECLQRGEWLAGLRQQFPEDEGRVNAVSGRVDAQIDDVSRLFAAED